MSRYVRAGMLSLALLLASRVLGLVRESALAAAFGVTAVADVVVAMLTLPDLVSSTVAAGALGLVLLPWWARQAPDGQRASQRRVMGFLLMVGAALALWILLVPHQLAFLLAPGLGGEERALLESGLRWSACAVPASLAGALWYTRLQHERDVVGMYGMNIVHTGTVLAVLFPLTFVFHGADAVLWMGAGLLAAMGLRLVFLRWRLSRVRAREAVPLAPVTGLPTWKIWFWTLAATGFPVVLPVVARSLISDNGAGALATFNYAWKLVELPNLLAIQLVSTLAFPAIARAHAEGRNFHFALKQALVLAWTLACAAALALHVGSGPLSALLFGWGRMGPEHVAEVARWSAWGAWTLLPQAVISVLVTVLAILQKMRAAALAYALALIVLLASGVHQPGAVMAAMVLALTAVACVMLAAVWREVLPSLPWRELTVPFLACGLLAWLAANLSAASDAVILGTAAFSALILMVVSAWLSPTLKSLYRR